MACLGRGAGDLPFFYNVSAVVGVNSANHPDDVTLVQWLMQKIGAKLNSANGYGANFAAAASYVSVNGQCDENTRAAIVAFQNWAKSGKPGTIVDGRVSPCTGSNYGTGYFTICDLNFLYRKYYWSSWPLFDAEPDSTPAVADLVSVCLYGKPAPTG